MNIVKLKVVATLEQTAASINRQFEIAEKEYEKGRGARAKERYARVTAGLQLLDARQRVELGRETNMGWEEWCEQNIDRGQRDIRAVMALATKVRDNAAAEQVVEQERAVNREKQRKSRADRSDRPSVTPLSRRVEMALGLVQAMTPDEFAQFYAQLVHRFDLRRLSGEIEETK